MKPVKIRGKRWIYAVWSIIGGIVFVVSCPFLDAGEDHHPAGAFIFLVASLFTLFSVIQLIRHKPELVITISGIAVERSLHRYTWDQISAIKSFCRVADEGDDQYFLVLAFPAGKDHQIDVSTLEKNVHEIVALVQQYSDRNTIYQGHFII